ncbi:MAG: methyltransferase family protein [Limnospira sp.]
MNEIFKDWGLTWEGLKTGKRGEYLVAVQGLILVGFVLLPVYPIPGLEALKSSPWMYFIWGLSILFDAIAVFLMVKGLMDLGENLTPLPYPKDTGNLIQSGVYNFVRHPLYSGLIFITFGWTLFFLSLSHFAITAILFVFLDIKSRREEQWLIDKYPEYSEYKQRVKKLIPLVY